MKLRPRLLVGSVVVAIVIVAGFAYVVGRDTGAGSPDAVLADPNGLDPASDQPSPDDPSIGNRRLDGAAFPVDADLTDRAGNSVSSSELLGEPLVVNFWFSTCAPCAKELPEFAAVHAERGDEVRFVGVNTIDSIEVMEEFAGDRGVTYELFRDELAELTDGIDAVAFPITIFVAPEGTIVEQTGVLDADELNDAIDELLAAST